MGHDLTLDTDLSSIPKNSVGSNQYWARHSVDAIHFKEEVCDVRRKETENVEVEYVASEILLPQKPRICYHQPLF